MIERLLVVAGGVLALYFGYRLFIPDGRAEAGAQKGEIRFGSFLSIHAVRMGPGIFFAAFGAYILFTSLTRPIQVTNTEVPASAAALKAQTPAVPRRALSEFKGAIPNVALDDPASLIRQINAIELGLSRQGAHSRPLKMELEEAKKRLLKRALPGRDADVDRYLQLLGGNQSIPDELREIDELFAPVSSVPAL